MKKQLDFTKNPKDLTKQTPNGLRYLRWGGDGEAVQPEKWQGVEKCLGWPQNPQRQVHALLGDCGLCKTLLLENRTTPFVTWFYTRHSYLQAQLCHWNQDTFTKTQNRELAETFAEKLTLLKNYFARKNEPDKKAWPKLTETFAEKM